MGDQPRRHRTGARGRVLSGVGAGCLTLLLGTSLVSAQTKQSGQNHAAYQPHFRRLGAYDYLAAGLVTAAYFSVELTQQSPHEAHWTEPLPLDRPLRDAFAADSRGARDAAAYFSDNLWYASVVYPVLESLAVPAIRTESAEVSWQMTAMNLQSFMLASLLVRMPHKWVGRERPEALACAKDPQYSKRCGTDAQYVSFPGGHLGISMTAAGLSCAHHLHGSLYGSPLGDGLACGGALLAASAVGYLRLRADTHWFSDQLAGTAIGLFSGYLMPTLLYYHPFWEKRPEASRSGQPRNPPPRTRLAVLPWLDPTTLGAAVMLVN